MLACFMCLNVCVCVWVDNECMCTVQGSSKPPLIDTPKRLAGGWLHRRAGVVEHSLAIFVASLRWVRTGGENKIEEKWRAAASSLRASRDETRIGWHGEPKDCDAAALHVETSVDGSSRPMEENRSDHTESVPKKIWMRIPQKSRESSSDRSTHAKYLVLCRVCSWLCLPRLLRLMW